MKLEDLHSPRLKRVYEYLSANGSGTTKEIEDRCQVASARDYIRRLRDHGCSIETIEEGINQNGARVVRYRLISSEAKQGELFASV